MRLYTFYVIALISNQLKQYSDAYWQAVKDKAIPAIAKKFDQLVTVGPVPTGMPNFGTLSTVTNTADVGSIPAEGWAAKYTEIVSLLATANYSPLGVGMNPLGVAKTHAGLLTGVNTFGGNPFPGAATLVNSNIGGVGTGSTVGYVGDFSLARWGTLGNIVTRESDSATLINGSITVDGSQVLGPDNVVSTYQRNMTAILVEVPLAFGVIDPNAFVKLTNGTAAA